MRITTMLARKDIRTLVRSRALLVVLILYPVLLAAVLGAVLLQANKGARIALVNRDTAGDTLRVGDASFGVDEYRRQAKRAGVDIVDMKLSDAKRALDEGQVQGVLVIPEGFVAQLQTQLSPASISLYTGSSALSDLVSQRVRGVMYKINLKISKALIDENDKYLNRLIKGGDVSVLGQSYTLYGLDPLRDDLERARSSITDPDARRAVDRAIAFADDAGTALHLADNALSATAAPIRIHRVIKTGKSPALTAKALSFALSITISLICMTLVAASLASERDERVLPRLLHSGATRGHVLASKTVLGISISLVVSLGLFATCAVLAPQAWTRLPLLLICVVASAAAFASLGALIAVLAGDARSATLVALLTALPMIPVALVGGHGLLPTVSRALPLTPSMTLFNDALFEPSPWVPLAQGVGHLALLAVIFSGASFRLLRRLG